MLFFSLHSSSVGYLACWGSVVTARCLLCPASSTALNRCSFMFECESYSAFFSRGESATNNHSTNRPETERKKVVNCFVAALNNMAHLRLRFKVGMSVIWLLAKVLSSTEKETTPPPPFPVAAHKKCRKCQHIYLCLVHVPLSQTKINPFLNVFSFI